MLQESNEIAAEFGAREAASFKPDEYEGIVIDPTTTHILEWHAGQFANKKCPRCSMPMRLQWRMDQRFEARPNFFWGCTGYFSPPPRQCRQTSPVTQADMGALIRKDNEAFAMSRDEIIRRAFDEEYKWKIGNDLRSLQTQPFEAYRCPLHGRAMILQRKKEPDSALDVWYMKCPSPIPLNGGWGCSQMVKLKSVAQILAVREHGTGRIF